MSPRPPPIDSSEGSPETMNVKKIKKMLKEKGYSDKAINEILSWYGYVGALDENVEIR